MKRTILTIVMAAGCVAASAQLRLTEDNIKEVVAAMTLEEKAEFVVGTQRGNIYPPPPAPGMPVRPAEDSLNHAAAKRKQQMASGKTQRAPNAVTAFSEGRVRGAAGDVLPIERLGVTTMVLADGPAGLRIDPKRPDDTQTYYCTAFPTASLLAATWDAPLVEQLAQSMGEEVRDYGVDILLAPGMNIVRNPLCGRNYEYFSEDPLLAGKLAAAYIRGVQSKGVGVSLKHFAVNNQETYRNGINVKLSRRALREIYLRGFEIAVKEGRPWTVMSSYNKINGVLASESRWLLTDVLRGEWGFDGFVMTDWWAEENGARQIAAGNDMLMPGTQRQMNEIVDGVRRGTLEERQLDWCVENILRVLVKSPSFRRYPYSNRPDLKAHADVARRVAAEGMVLLRNEAFDPQNGQKAAPVLPLTTSQRVALLGVDSYDALVGGSGSGHVNRRYEVSVYDGLRNAGFHVDEQQSRQYLDYVSAEKAKQGEQFFWMVPVIPEIAVDELQAEQLAQRNDVCVLTIGRMAGEGADRRLEKGDYELSDVETANLERLCAAFHRQHKPIVVLLSMGSMVDMATWQHLPDAILHTWLSGQEEGNAIADVLTGRVSPSGKLPFTIAARYEDYPSAGDFPQSNGNPAEVEYREGTDVGYRHFNSHHIAPLYPFGYGLSYTAFKYGSPRVQVGGDSIAVSLKVKNIGRRAGKEVVQLYADGQLVAFGKTATLQPGATEQLTLTAARSLLDRYDEQADCWLPFKGDCLLEIAASAADVRKAVKVRLK